MERARGAIEQPLAPKPIPNGSYAKGLLRLFECFGMPDCHAFLLAKENWAERAAAHSWTDLELFGCCRCPLERLGNAGLLWAINGGRLVELRRDWAVIERASDRCRQVHQRERPKAADITLPWIGLR
jgi:hypothetical protein